MLQVYVKEEKYFPQTEINLPRFSLPTTERELDITEHEDCSFLFQSLSIPDGPWEPRGWAIWRGRGTTQAILNSRVPSPESFSLESLSWLWSWSMKNSWYEISTHYNRTNWGRGYKSSCSRAVCHPRKWWPQYLNRCVTYILYPRNDSKPSRKLYPWCKGPAQYPLPCTCACVSMCVYTHAHLPSIKQISLGWWNSSLLTSLASKKNKIEADFSYHHQQSPKIWAEKLVY